MRAFYTEDAERVLTPVRQFLVKQGVEAKYVHRIGSAAANIAKLAQRGKFDLVMMGSHGHGVLGSVVMGSVVTRVLARCQTPVLIVR